MPGLQGPEVVQRIRGKHAQTPTYVILLTSRDSSADIVAGPARRRGRLRHQAGERRRADRARQRRRPRRAAAEALAERVRSLEEALANVKALQTLLPMCAYCKSIRNDQNYWEKVETYFTQHSSVSFTHSYCPNCYERFVRPELEALETQPRRRRIASGASDDRPGVLDPAVVESLRQLTPPGEPDVLGEVLRCFSMRCRGVSERLEAPGAAGNTEELQRAAHSLKGSAGNIGARQLFDVCKQLDERGKAGDLSGARHRCGCARRRICEGRGGDPPPSRNVE